MDALEVDLSSSFVKWWQIYRQFSDKAYKTRNQNLNYHVLHEDPGTIKVLASVNLIGVYTSKETIIYIYIYIYWRNQYSRNDTIIDVVLILKLVDWLGRN